MKPLPPIAIVGQSCLLPGASSPQALWDHVAHRRSLLSTASAARLRVDPALIRGPGQDAADGLVGGYVLADPLTASAPEAAGLDPLFHWVIHVGRGALQDAGLGDLSAARRRRTGAIVGNLSFPTEGMARAAEDSVLERQGYQPFRAERARLLGAPAPNPRDRFMSGLPAHLLAEALGLGGGALCIDAACASSLYAIRLAAEWLAERKVDLMLAGAVNRADPLFLQIGFSALQALSRTGVPRPFDRRADGLIPAEGAAMVALMRLEDAEAERRPILGVVLGVGLSNDGRGSGLLAPSLAGQARAMRAAYAMSGIDPASVELIEAHATGTPLGDATELESLRAVFGGSRPGSVRVGSLKSNLGHLITAAGLAGLQKVLGSFAREAFPPTINAEEPIAGLDGASPFRLSAALAPWPARDHPRRAAVSAFGFGGNNAHLIVEEHRPRGARPAPARPTPAPALELAVVAIARRFKREGLPVDLLGIRFPPKDLALALPQQLLALEVARDVARGLDERALPSERTGVLFGMSCDVRVTTHGVRWRALDWSRRLAPGLDRPAREAWGRSLRAAVTPPLSAPGVVGTMPNIVANRINTQLGLGGPSFVVSAEELSGIAGLELARTLIAAQDLDACIVGAVDDARDARHQDALRAQGIEGGLEEGLAVAMVVMAKARAVALGLPVLAVLDSIALASDAEAPTSSGHAAAGLSAVVDWVEHLSTRARPAPTDATLRLPWLVGVGQARRAELRLGAMGGAVATLSMLEADRAPVLSDRAPLLCLFAAASKAELLAQLKARASGSPAEERAASRAAMSPSGLLPHRAALVARSRAELGPLLERARLLLEGAPRLPSDDAIYLGEGAALGALAFVFGGAAAPYGGMGQGLLLGYPELSDRLSAKLGAAAASLALAEPSYERYLDQLLGASALMQAHALFTQEILGLRPAAAIGYSLGESNALLALGAWTDAEQMLEEVTRSPLFSQALAAPHTAAQRWLASEGQPATSGAAWACVTLLAPLPAVRAAVSGERHAFLCLINTDDECVVGGAQSAVARVIAKLGCPHVPLPSAPSVHCPAVQPVAAEYRALHHRPVRAVPGVRFYGHGVKGPYEISADACADALLAQALGTVDFPSLVRRAYDDGVRVFVDHGPRGLCAGWIGRILAGRPHVALAMDAAARSPELEALRVAAGLFAAGLRFELDRILPRLSDPPRQLLEPMSGFDPPLPVFPGPPAPVMEHMPAPPPLPPVRPTPAEAKAVASPHAPRPSPLAAPLAAPLDAPPTAQLDAAPTSALAAMGAAHRAFLDEQARAHRRFLELRAAEEARLFALMSAPEVSAEVTPVVQPSALWLDRAGLERAASGRLSEVFGPLFERQDHFRRQVRMPMPPLLLADRVLSIDARPGVLEPPASIRTETDVAYDAWYLHDGRVPASVLIEAGQADLLLVSYMGVDFDNRGERVYRLLGCDLRYHGALPPAGTTLHYDIHVDGFATHGDTRIFFFHSDCRAGGPDGPLLLSVRGGQAGFFSDEELDRSGGVLFDPRTAPPPSALPWALPPRPSKKRSFSGPELQAWVRGDAYACFGEGFDAARTHVATPRIAAGRLLLVDRVTAFEPSGGPWGRGYLSAELDLSEASWFFAGHFKDDPCMPGTLMLEGALQCLAIHLAALGVTRSRDGHRFQPAPGREAALRCRGQATPRSRRLVYEVFVKSVVEEGEPRLLADVLVSVDGLKSLHAKDLELWLVPDQPLDRRYDLLGLLPREGNQDAVGGIGRDLPAIFDQTALLATALGRPSLAFGEMYRRFDGGRRIPRLPGPPYHFMSRVVALSGPAQGVMEPGGTAIVDYDVPPEAWYFERAGNGRMPFGVLLEVALQPCGWLSSYVGSALSTEVDLYYRNLDGRAVVHREVGPDEGTLRTKTTLTSCSRSGDMIIQGFELEVSGPGGPVLSATTVFGFFPAEALAEQVGLGSTRSALHGSAHALHDGGAPPLPGPMLRMIDRIVADDPAGGRAGLGRVIAEKTVDPDEWFFKAHFFQDPVQPGSLGLEAMLQTLAWAAQQRGLGRSLRRPRFRYVAPSAPLVWKYRGQVLPRHETVRIELDVTAASESGLEAEALLWADGLCIYRASGLVVQVVEAD